MYTITLHPNHTELSKRLIGLTNDPEKFINDYVAQRASIEREASITHDNGEISVWITNPNYTKHTPDFVGDKAIKYKALDRVRHYNDDCIIARLWNESDLSLSVKIEGDAEYLL
jgi:hypothetical protein